MNTDHPSKGHFAPSLNLSVEDWEEWEDASVVTPIEDDEQVLVQYQAPRKYSQHLRPPRNAAVRVSRYSTVKIKRLKSRQRQKAQNAKAGISVITDMATFARKNHVVDQMKQPSANGGKFVDSAALRALEGEPSSASIGNWNWLKRNRGQSPATTSTQNDPSPVQGLSPGDRPIMIGISVPPRDASSFEPTPYTAHPDQSALPFAASARNENGQRHHGTEPRSFWSPDTPDTTQSFVSPRHISSMYSQAPPPRAADTRDMPPIPSLPQQFKKHCKSVNQQDGDNDDIDSPCTLFEEDGTSPKGRITTKKPVLSPESAGSPSRGWWDHVVSPFADKRMTLSNRKQKLESPRDTNLKSFQTETPPEQYVNAEFVQPSSIAKPPIVRIPTPRRTPSPGPSASSSQTTATRVAPLLSESQGVGKPEIVIEDEESTIDNPPPYSPAKRPELGPIRYRAVFPPGHALHSQFPPSPNPGSPGLAATMTSQGSTQMNNMGSAIGNTSPVSHVPLPARPIGTYLPPEHVYPARGPQHSVERRRRRHEKEDMIARKAGGFWRGRGCVPKTGCYGRTGREGRKKRRYCLGIWVMIIALLILTTILSVVLTRPHPAKDIPSIWVNLTDFPPMPTGVLTVAGTDNTVARSVCTEPSTLWSCSLPKDNQQSVAPYKPNQPTVIMQIQWDNSTRQLWKAPNGVVPPSISKRAPGFISRARSVIQARAATDFKPDPPAPNFQDMWFMGETTDGIISDQKAGEPAPFYISILQSINATAENPILQRRDEPTVGNISLSALLPPPDLSPDGTPVPAVMLPNPVQQPVRLYDRGLETEHYGFYTHFKRTIFLKSVTAPNNTDSGNVPLDEDGGCRKSEAGFLTTWGETRMLVRIWTRKLASNTSSLVRPDGSSGIGGVNALRRPGTMPWPVTITLDTHGGDAKKKLVWETPMDDRQRLSLEQSRLLVNNMDIGGTWINPRGTGDAKFGGFDGGTGGCKCEWVNWV